MQEKTKKLLRWILVLPTYFAGHLVGHILMVFLMLFSLQWKEYWLIEEQGGFGSGWLSGISVIGLKSFLPPFFAMAIFVFALPKYKKIISRIWGGLLIACIVSILIATKLMHPISTEQFIANILRTIFYSCGIVGGNYYALSEEKLIGKKENQ